MPVKLPRVESCRARPSCRAPRRLGRDRRDRDPRRRSSRGAVPRPAVRDRPPSARRDRGRPPAGARADEGQAAPSSSSPSSSRPCEWRCASSAARPTSTTATCSKKPLEAVAKVSGRAATMKPGAHPPLDEQYFRRIAAIEYAVKPDDGLGRALPKADIVLVGVSRTSKTPLSIYLGYLGWKAANVPLVKGIEPPPELFEVDPAKVVGLTIDANRLAEIRAERIQLMGGDRRYASLAEIYEELEYAAGDPPPARLPRDRRLRAVDRGDRPADPPRGRPARARDARRVKPKPEGAALALGALVRDPRPRALRLLRPLHAGLVRHPLARLARGVSSPAARVTCRGCARFVYDFDEASAGGRELLGGKGMGLAEMTLMGLPVPGGLHDHHRRLPGVHERRATCPTGLEAGGRRARPRGSSRGPASASATTTTRSSSPCAPAPPSRCRG